jgi:hypothetical protein
MKRILVSLLAGALLAGVCVAQSAQSQATVSESQTTNVSTKNAQAASAVQLQAGSTVQAELVKSVDARKNKVGDEVIAKTTHDVKSDGQIVIPRGSKLVGHVTEVKANSKEQVTSELGIAFDHAILKNGAEMPIVLSIQAIGRSRSSASAMEDDTMSTGNAGGTGSSGARHSSGGSVLGNVRSTAGGVVDTAGSAAGAAVNSSAGAAGGGVSSSLSASSRGVIGLPGLRLSTETSNSANASVIRSQGSNVHLDSGTEMILRVNR